jgi:hypothetical protein
LGYQKRFPTRLLFFACPIIEHLCDYATRRQLSAGPKSISMRANLPSHSDSFFQIWDENGWLSRGLRKESRFLEFFSSAATVELERQPGESSITGRA